MTQDSRRQMLHIHERAIRRSSRYWLDAVERLQSGNLSAEAWIGAYVGWLGGLRQDLDDLLALHGRPRPPAPPPGAASDPKGGTNG